MTAGDARTEVIPAVVDGDAPLPAVVPVGGKAPLPRRTQGQVPPVSETTPPSGLPVLPSTVELGVVVVEAAGHVAPPLSGLRARRRPAPRRVIDELEPSDTPTYDVLAAWFAPQLVINLEEVRRAW